MVFNKTSLLLVFGALSILPACNKDSNSPVDCTGVTSTYTADIKPIIDVSCLGCHNGSLSESGIDLSNYNGVVAKANDGRLLGAIQHQSGFTPMPKDSPKLSSDKIQSFVCWVENGVPQ